MLPLLPLLVAAPAFADSATGPIVVPFTQLESGHILVPVTVGSVHTQFVLDTGASVSVVLPATWGAMGNDPAHGLKVGGQGAGGAVGARVVKLPTMDLGDRTIDVGYAVVMDVAAEAPAEGEPAKFGGIFGEDLLRRYVVQLDFETHTLTLYGASDVAPTPTLTAPLRRLRGGLLGIDLTISGKTVPAVLDLGSAATILSNDAVGFIGATMLAACGRKAVGADHHALDLACVGPVTVGAASHSFGDVGVNVADLPVFSTLRMAGPAAILGVDLLGHGRLIFDPRHKRIGWL